MTAQSGGLFITQFKWDGNLYFCEWQKTTDRIELYRRTRLFKDWRVSIPIFNPIHPHERTSVPSGEVVYKVERTINRRWIEECFPVDAMSEPENPRHWFESLTDFSSFADTSSRGVLKVVSLLFLFILIGCGTEEKTTAPPPDPAASWFDNSGYEDAIRESIETCKTKAFERFGNLFARDYEFDEFDIDESTRGHWMYYDQGVVLNLVRTTDTKARADIKITEIGDIGADYYDRGIECEVIIKFSDGKIETLNITGSDTFLNAV